MLTDTEKATLVEELAEALRKWDNSTEEMDKIDWSKSLEDLYREQAATACLPIINRLLAERDLDALLDSVGGELDFIHDGKKGPASPHWYEDPPAERRFRSRIIIRREQAGQAGYWITEYRGTGPTRTAAVQAAVKAAKEAQG